MKSGMGAGEWKKLRDGTGKTVAEKGKTVAEKGKTVAGKGKVCAWPLVRVWCQSKRWTCTGIA